VITGLANPAVVRGLYFLEILTVQNNLNHLKHLQKSNRFQSPGFPGNSDRHKAADLRPSFQISHLGKKTLETPRPARLTATPFNDSHA